MRIRIFVVGALAAGLCVPTVLGGAVPAFASGKYSASCAVFPGNTVVSWHNSHPGVTNFEIQWTDSFGNSLGRVPGTVNSKQGEISNTATVPTPSGATTGYETLFNGTNVLAGLSQACT